MPPGVAALYEAGLTPSQDVFESRWSWADSTGWVLVIPLVEVFWRWEHIIGSSDQAWNFMILGARPLGFQRGNFFESTKATCQGIKAISQKTDR